MNSQSSSPPNRVCHVQIFDDRESEQFPGAQELEDINGASYHEIPNDERHEVKSRRSRGGVRKLAAVVGAFIACGGFAAMSSSAGWLPIVQWSQPRNSLSKKFMPFNFDERSEATWGIDLPDPRKWDPETWKSGFKHFYDRFEKTVEYSSDSYEYQRRFTIFKGNVRKIWDHNNGIKLLGDREMTDVKLAPNQFSDFEYSEFLHRNLMQGKPQPSPFDLAIPRLKGDILSYIAKNDTIPSAINWNSRGCVTPIKNQGRCGSCWAFSTTGAIEGALCAQNGVLLDLSEQQLVDCGRATHGCNGGLMDQAFQYVIENGGLCSEEEYPYLAKQGECRAKSCKAVAHITGLLDVPPGDVDALKAAVALYGPVSVGIEADKPAFQFYHKGIFNLKCGKHLNHAVLVVGFGSDETGEGFWLVKNSWGELWGDHGFVRISMALHKHRGECGILLAPSLPIVENAMQ